MSMRTLDQVVREYLIRIGAEGINNRYSRFLQLGIAGLRDLHYDKADAVAYAILEIGENETVTLPEDYIHYKKVGVCLNGIVVGLGGRDNMCPPTTDDCGDLVVDQPTLPDNTWDGTFWNYGGNNWNVDGFNVGRDYGLGGGQNAIGYFKIFPERGYIALQNMSTSFTEIVLEYDCDLEKVGANHLVHQYEVEAVQSWIAWKSIIDSRTYSLGEKDIRKRQYQSDKFKALSMQNRFQLNELMSVYRSGYKSSPKL